MRILIGANHYFGDVRGGGNRVAWDAARHLAKQGHDVALLCEGVAGKAESERVDNVLILRYRIAPLNLNFVARHQNAGEKILKKHLSGWNPDLLWGHMPLQMMAMLNSFPGVRVSYTVHSPVALEILAAKTNPDVVSRVKSFVTRRMERRCCRQASVITVLSRYTESELVKMHGEEIADRIQITPGWADLGKFNPAPSRDSAKEALGRPIDRPVFFSLRRLVARMGLDRLVTAAGIVRDRGLMFQLYIGGTGPLRESLAKQIESLQLSDCVSLIGEVPESELSAQYAAADAFVIPTRALECFGLIAVEAMAAGTPVLSTPVGALPEIIGQIEPRWLTRDNSAEAIAETMCDFIQGGLPVHSAAEIRAFVESNYDQSKALDRYVSAAIGEGSKVTPELAERQSSGG